MNPLAVLATAGPAALLGITRIAAICRAGADRARTDTARLTQGPTR